jgi:hypothetical protein
MRIFSSAEWCFRVARRISYTICSGVARVSDFCLICAYPVSYDEPEILSSSSCPICLRTADAGHRERLPDLPLDWNEQAQLLGFHGI